MKLAAKVQNRVAKSVWGAAPTSPVVHAGVSHHIK